MAIKNSLTVDDAQAVDEAFRVKLDDVGRSEADTTDASSSMAIQSTWAPPARGIAKHAHSDAEVDPIKPFDEIPIGLGSGIDKSLLAISEPRRYRNKAHLKFVASQACLICGRQPVDPHHLGFAQPRAIGRKVSDEFTVPLCRTHHREVHRSGNEANWWKQYSLDPLTVAAALWAQTHPMRPTGQPILDQMTPSCAATSQLTPVAALPRPVEIAKQSQ